MIKRFNIALDGPVGSGKTTIGKSLAQKLNYNFLDSGLLYRHFALFYQNLLAEQNIFSKSLMNNFSEIDKTISQWQEIFASNEENFIVELEKKRNLLGSPEISNLASRLSPNAKLRKVILYFQQKLTTQKGWVVAGRDITSEVLPQAEVKIFLTASLETRANRRYEQYQKTISWSEIARELEQRDERDKKRKNSPLQKTVDSYELDTTSLSFEESTKKILDIMKNIGYDTEK